MHLPTFIVCKNCFRIFSELRKPFADKILIKVLASITVLLLKSDEATVCAFRTVILLTLLRALRAVLVDAMTVDKNKGGG